MKVKDTIDVLFRDADVLRPKEKKELLKEISFSLNHNEKNFESLLDECNIKDLIYTTADNAWCLGILDSMKFNGKLTSSDKHQLAKQDRKIREHNAEIIKKCKCK